MPHGSSLVAAAGSTTHDQGAGGDVAISAGSGKTAASDSLDYVLVGAYFLPLMQFLLLYASLNTFQHYPKSSQLKAVSLRFAFYDSTKKYFMKLCTIFQRFQSIFGTVLYGVRTPVQYCTLCITLH
jgi:hypothetical protein